MEELVAFIVTLVIGAILSAFLIIDSMPNQVEAGYGYKWKCSGSMVAKVGDVYYDVKPCERVKKETK